MRTLSKLGIVSLLALCACGSADNTNNAQHVGDDLRDGGAGTEGSTCTSHATTDDPDDNGVDENCDGADGVIGTDVYVSTSGADTNAGTAAQPLRSLGAALTLATGRGGRVLVSSGTYTLDALKAAGTWSVFGGYPTTFVGAPRRGATTLAASGGALLIDRASSAHLAHLTVRGAAPNDDKHPAGVALASNADKLALDDVELDAPDGRDGATGAAGMGGDPGAQGGDADTPTRLLCKGIVQPSFAYGATKYLPNAEGKRAGDFPSKRAADTGSAGAAGTDGVDADGTPKLVDGAVVAGAGTQGDSNGRAGYGGPGGGGGTTNRQYIGGAGGSGGCPGGGGSGGLSGGASIGILVMRGSVSITRSNLHSGLGGAGGDGGEGGAGGAGGLPGLPTASPSTTFPSLCTSGNDPAQANCSAYGGAGGAGGAGGHGGGGAGGWTIGVVTANGAAAQIDDATTVDLGRPGNGGVGAGGGRAPNGRSLRVFALP